MVSRPIVPVPVFLPGLFDAPDFDQQVPFFRLLFLFVHVDIVSHVQTFFAGKERRLSGIRRRIGRARADSRGRNVVAGFFVEIYVFFFHGSIMPFVLRVLAGSAWPGGKKEGAGENGPRRQGMNNNNFTL